MSRRIRKQIDEASLLEEWNERAAIREFDAKQTRQRADFLALIEVKRMYGWFPIELEQLIVSNYRSHLLCVQDCNNEQRRGKA
jgi:hypothetical protein